MSTDDDSEGGNDEKSFGEHDWNELIVNAKLGLCEGAFIPFHSVHDAVFMLLETDLWSWTHDPAEYNKSSADETTLPQSVVSHVAFCEIQ